jgi:hypothetical protein
MDRQRGGRNIVNVQRDCTLPISLSPPIASSHVETSRYLAAIVSHDDRTLRIDGTTRITQYQDRFFRGPNHVWVERVVPAALEERLALRDASGEPRLRLTARLVTREPSGAASLCLVSRGERLIIDVSADDYDTFGFGGTFEAAASLVDPDVLQEMRPGRVALQGRWYEQKTEDGVFRVEWSSRLRLALATDRVTSDSSQSTHMTVELRASPGMAELPWNRIDDFRHANFSDLGESG